MNFEVTKTNVGFNGDDFIEDLITVKFTFKLTPNRIKQITEYKHYEENTDNYKQQMDNRHLTQ